MSDYQNQYARKTGSNSEAFNLAEEGPLPVAQRNRGHVGSKSSFTISRAKSGSVQDQAFDELNGAV